MRNKLRLATWIVCLLAIMVSFACVITAANNIVENNACKSDFYLRYR